MYYNLSKLKKMLDKKAKEAKKQNWMEKNVRGKTGNQMIGSENTWSKKTGRMKVT